MDLKVLFLQGIPFDEQRQDGYQTLFFCAGLINIISFDYICDTYSEFMESANISPLYLDNHTSGSGDFFYQDAAAQTD